MVGSDNIQAERHEFVLQVAAGCEDRSCIQASLESTLELDKRKKEVVRLRRERSKLNRELTLLRKVIDHHEEVVSRQGTEIKDLKQSKKETKALTDYHGKGAPASSGRKRRRLETSDNGSTLPFVIETKALTDYHGKGAPASSGRKRRHLETSDNESTFAFDIQGLLHHIRDQEMCIEEQDLQIEALQHKVEYQVNWFFETGKAGGRTSEQEKVVREMMDKMDEKEVKLSENDEHIKSQRRLIETLEECLAAAERSGK
ncbi:MAG: hypothetical protein Q9178_006474 [Gyalolechia marmorata]